MGDIASNIMKVYERGLGIAQNTVRFVSDNACKILLLGSLSALVACGTAGDNNGERFDTDRDGRLNTLSEQIATPSIEFDTSRTPPAPNRSLTIQYNDQGFNAAVAAGFRSDRIQYFTSIANSDVVFCNQKDHTPTLYTGVFGGSFFGASDEGKVELAFQHEPDWGSYAGVLAIPNKPGVCIRVARVRHLRP
ncbi:MAG: hypothetical protein AAF569_01815 [Pseudomonadota bacterium]